MKKQDNQREATLFAYLSGIIDGEGTIRICKYVRKGWSDRYSASISIGMSDKRIIELFAEKFGGKIRIECVPNRKIMYRWGTSGNIIVPKILNNFMPYLIVKKEQAKLVIEFCKKIDNKNSEIRKCLKCDKELKIHGYGLCENCYQLERRKNTLSKYSDNYIRPNKYLSVSELQRRKSFYLKVRKLNEVGAPATTKRDDTREGEAIV